MDTFSGYNPTYYDQYATTIPTDTKEGHAETRTTRDDSPQGIQQESIFVLSKSNISPRGLTLDVLRQLYYTDQLSFLQVLCKISPFLSSTIRIALSLAIADGNFSITVREKDSPNVLEDETNEAKNFFEKQPKYTGDLPNIIGKLLQEMMFTADGCAFEGIFNESDDEGSLGYERFEIFTANSVHVGVPPETKLPPGLYQKKSDGTWIRLSDYHVYWQPNDPTVESPSGTYALSSALAEGMGELLTSRDLRDGVNAAGNPVRMYTYNRDGLIKTAIETLRVSVQSAKVIQFVQDQVKQIEDYVKKRKKADTIVVASDVQAMNIQPADFQKVIPALDVMQTRFAASINNGGALLGFGEATKGSLQYQLVATNITNQREKCLKLIERAMARHFQLQGKLVDVSVDAPIIHLTDELVAQNTAQMKFLNELMKYAMGLISFDEFSRIICGHSPSGEAVDGALEAILKIASNGGVDKNDSRQTEKSGGKAGNPDNGK